MVSLQGNIPFCSGVPVDLFKTAKVCLLFVLICLLMIGLLFIIILRDVLAYIVKVSMFGCGGSIKIVGCNRGGWQITSIHYIV